MRLITVFTCFMLIATMAFAQNPEPQSIVVLDTLFKSSVLKPKQFEAEFKLGDTILFDFETEAELSHIRVIYPSKYQLLIPRKTTNGQRLVFIPEDGVFTFDFGISIGKRRKCRLKVQKITSLMLQEEFLLKSDLFWDEDLIKRVCKKPFQTVYGDGEDIEVLKEKAGKGDISLEGDFTDEQALDFINTPTKVEVKVYDTIVETRTRVVIKPLDTIPETLYMDYVNLSPRLDIINDSDLAIEMEVPEHIDYVVYWLSDDKNSDDHYNRMLNMLPQEWVFAGISNPIEAYGLDLIRNLPKSQVSNNFVFSVGDHTNKGYRTSVRYFDSQKNKYVENFGKVLNTGNGKMYLCLMNKRQTSASVTQAIVVGFDIVMGEVEEEYEETIITTKIKSVEK